MSLTLRASKILLSTNGTLAVLLHLRISFKRPQKEDQDLRKETCGSGNGKLIELEKEDQDLRKETCGSGNGKLIELVVTYH
jgi:hypothetical protein